MITYQIMYPSAGVEPPKEDVEAALLAAGFVRWDGEGKPGMVVLCHSGTKGEWFEAGLRCGFGSPLFVVGRRGGLGRRRALVERLGAQAVNVEDPAALAAAARRRFGLREPREVPR